ncbi:MAG TPA: DUF402 domain-containing protein [Tepidiformaceae bacterium]|nr:DUF402 domain-containing protein [Tepidiformaceae bacterium]
MVSPLRRFEPGEPILLRGPFIDDAGRQPPVICDVRPVVVVEDSDDLVSLFLPAGTPTKMSRPLDPRAPRPWMAGNWELVESTWDRWNTLHLIVPGAWHSTWVMWTAAWDFLGWYANLQEPLRRTPFGFDSRDLQLDILVGPDRRWRWKDEDDLRRSVETGLFTPALESRIRQEAAAVIEAIESGAPPFTADCAAWRPDPGWPAPTLPTSNEYLSPEPN